MFALNRNWLVMVAFLFCFAETANADLFPLFSDDGGATFSNSYVVVTGNTQTVDVFLGQNGANTELSTVGLFSMGLTATTPSTTAASITSATPNPVFDFVTTDQFDADSFDWNAAAVSNPTPMAVEIYLGSFDVTTVADGTTIFSFADIQPGTGAANANWLTPDATVLDESIFGAGGVETFDLTIVSQVPEPCAGTLLAFLCVGIVRRRAR